MPLIIIFGIAARYLLKYVITKTLLVVGMGFITYQGIGSLVDDLETALVDQYGGLPGDVWNIISLCGLDVAITILLSAMTLALTIKGLKAGAKILSSIGR